MNATGMPAKFTSCVQISEFYRDNILKNSKKKLNKQRIIKNPTGSKV